MKVNNIGRAAKEMLKVSAAALILSVQFIAWLLLFEGALSNIDSFSTAGGILLFATLLPAAIAAMFLDEKFSKLSRKQSRNA